VGGALARGLSELGCDVVASGRGARAPEIGRAPFRRCELSDPVTVTELCGDGFDAVVHAAATLRSDAGLLAPLAKDNVLATATLLDACLDRGIGTFVYLSSISVYSGDGPFAEDSPTGPSDGYGWSKLAGESLVSLAARRGITAAVLRLAGVHGMPRRDGIIHEFAVRALAGEPLLVREPETRMTPTFVTDAVAAVAAVLRDPSPRDMSVYNVATAEAPTQRDLALAIRHVFGSVSQVVERSGGRARNRVMRTGRIAEEIGFRPAPLEAHLASLAHHLAQSDAA
jgi:dTDP-glucose 4,6-dehydratase